MDPNEALHSGGVNALSIGQKNARLYHKPQPYGSFKAFTNGL